MSPHNPLSDILVNSDNHRSVDTDVEGEPGYFIPKSKRVTFDPNGSVNFPHSALTCFSSAAGGEA